MDTHKVIYIDGDTDTGDSFGKWFADSKYVNEPPQVFIREDIAQPKPSTDFTEVYDNPCEDYLFFDKRERQWFVGWYSDTTMKFYWTTHNLGGDEYLEPSHWLPLSPNH